MAYDVKIDFKVYRYGPDGPYVVDFGDRQVVVNPDGEVPSRDKANVYELTPWDADDIDNDINSLSNVVKVDIDEIERKPRKTIEKVIEEEKKARLAKMLWH